MSYKHLPAIELNQTAWGEIIKAGLGTKDVWCKNVSLWAPTSLYFRWTSFRLQSPLQVLFLIISISRLRSVSFRIYVFCYNGFDPTGIDFERKIPSIRVSLHLARKISCEIWAFSQPPFALFLFFKSTFTIDRWIGVVMMIQNRKEDWKSKKLYYDMFK